MQVFFKKTIPTPIGSLTACANTSKIELIKFSDSLSIKEKSLLKFCFPRPNDILDKLHSELDQYFNATQNVNFKINLNLAITPFQNLVYDQIMKIQYGDTSSYHEIATLINKPMASRAVALACAQNKFQILIPCHRVIAKSGKISGYNAGISRKLWLLNHEKIC